LTKKHILRQSSFFIKEGAKGRFYHSRSCLIVAFADSSDSAAGHCPVEVYGANLELQ